ncbi:MAG: endonuclease III [Oscillospiraceae bacterium]|jgi:endonuclease-3|nr:endonuclease III [Oscillospiraceae bacterium]
MTKKQLALEAINRLKILYPDAICSLDYQNPLHLLISVRLAAQCTDARVNQVTPALFASYPTLEALADAEPEDIEPYIHSCGFFRQKAKDIVYTCRAIKERFNGLVPDNMEDLLSLSGVGRKTANLILGDVYGKPAIVCDTHCIRISGRLGLTDGTKDPFKTEMQLQKLLPPEESSDFCHRLVMFGRDVCTARAPKCSECSLSNICKYKEDNVNVNN